MTTTTLSTIHLQTHVSDVGEIALPPFPETFFGENVTVKIDRQEKEKLSAQERKRAFEELCKPWREDERSTEEILRDIYESRTGSREREPL